MISEKCVVTFARDRDSGEISNFAGSVRPPETVLMGCCREFGEESLGVFGTLTPDMLSSCVAIYSKRELNIFVRMEWERVKVERLFADAMDRDSEMTELIFYEYDQLVEVLSSATNVFYDRVKSLFYNAIQQNEDLLERLTNSPQLTTPNA